MPIPKSELARIVKARQIHRQELELVIGKPDNPQQLARACNAHAAFLEWQAQPNKECWQRFNRLAAKV